GVFLAEVGLPAVTFRGLLVSDPIGLALIDPTIVPPHDIYPTWYDAGFIPLFALLGPYGRPMRSTTRRWSLCRRRPCRSRQPGSNPPAYSRSACFASESFRRPRASSPDCFSKSGGCVTGVELDGGVEVVESLVVLAFGVVGGAAAEPGVGVGRLELQGLG